MKLMCSDFKKMALERLRDAQTLFDACRYAGAYYLMGYVIEYALKAIIAKQTRRHEFPNKKRVEKSWSHDIPTLIKTAGLKDKANKQTRTFLATVNMWNSEARYKPTVSRKETEQLFVAVKHPSDGVLAWLKTYW
ncbi:MAG: HEPN domain-containing protein [Candidatus Coatesbacteria bacterium]|nr:HEPN domain-containing protein [Candidatus Coatesbacteria bacterium]